MKNYGKIMLLVGFLFSASAALSYAQDAIAPSTGASTIHTPTKGKKEGQHHKKAPKKHPKKKTGKTENTTK